MSEAVPGKNVVVLCGGRSAEHDVSLLSAASVLRNLDREHFAITVLGIGRDGSTMSASRLKAALQGVELEGMRLAECTHWLSLLLDVPVESTVVFPVLHGPYGEDGTIQGSLEMLDLAYVGASVFGSAVGMNKIACKAVLRDAGLPVLPAVHFNVEQWRNQSPALLRRISDTLQLPLFMKPANLGSSVGITRCTSADQLEEAVETALLFDEWVLAEQGVDAREIEVSVLGSFSPRASLPGEIIPSDAFYSYDAKYLSGTSQLFAPAPLSPDRCRELQELAVSTFCSLQLEGMARIDFLMERGTGKIWVSEANTIPGFTQISMYPKLWEISGLSYEDLLTELIDIAFERRTRRSLLRVDR